MKKLTPILSILILSMSFATTFNIRIPQPSSIIPIPETETPAPVNDNAFDIVVGQKLAGGVTYVGYANGYGSSDTTKYTAVNSNCHYQYEIRTTVLLASGEITEISAIKVNDVIYEAQDLSHMPYGGSLSTTGSNSFYNTDIHDVFCTSIGETLSIEIIYPE